MVWHRVNKVIAEGKTKTTVILYSYKIAMQVHNKTPGKKCTLNSNNLVLLLFFFRTAFFINVFPQTRGKREKPNWQNMFPADALCAYSTVSLPVSLSSLRIATRISLSTGVGNSSYCT